MLSATPTLIIIDKLSIPQHHLHDLWGYQQLRPLNSSRSSSTQCKPRPWPSHWVRSQPLCKYDSRKWVRSTECQNLGSSGPNWLHPFLYAIHRCAYSFNDPERALIWIAKEASNCFFSWQQRTWNPSASQVRSHLSFYFDLLRTFSASSASSTSST